MKIIYSDQEIKLVGNSIFLAGPTPRSPDVPSWRPDAIAYFEELKFDGTILVPEPIVEHWDYMRQVEWEWEGLENCSLILFWVPRQLDTMPAFTTNVEFGRYVGSYRMIYGRPDWAVKTDYLDWLYGKVAGGKPINSLEKLVTSAIDWFDI